MKIIFPDEERRKEYARVPHPTDAEKNDAFGYFARTLSSHSLGLLYGREFVEFEREIFEIEKDLKSKRALNRQILEADDDASHVYYTIKVIDKLRELGSHGWNIWPPADLKEVIRNSARHYRRKLFVERRYRRKFCVEMPRKNCNALTYDDFLYTLTTDILKGPHTYSPDRSKKNTTVLRLLRDASGHGYGISVSDNGYMIPEEHMGRLFDQGNFEWESDGKCHYFSGLGYAEEMLYSLDSRMEVESEKGKGTTFTIAPIRCVMPKEIPGLTHVMNHYDIKKRYKGIDKRGYEKLILFKSLPEKMGKIRGSERIEHIGGNFYAATGKDIRYHEVYEDVNRNGSEGLRFFYSINDRAVDYLLKEYSRVFEKDKVIMTSDMEKIDFTILGRKY